MLLASCTLRYTLVEHTPSHSNGLLDYLNHGLDGALRQSHVAVSEDDTDSLTWVPNALSTFRQCGWSPRLEALRSLLGVEAIILFVRLSEHLDVEEVGTLQLCFEKMIMRDLLPWFALVLTWMLGTSLSLSLLAPNFQGGSGGDSLNPSALNPGGDIKWFHYLDLSTKILFLLIHHISLEPLEERVFP